MALAKAEFDVAIIGSFCRDLIHYETTGKSIQQVGGGVFYGSLALSAVGAKVLSVPFLSKVDRDQLKHFDRPGMKTIPVWTNDSVHFELRYGASLDDRDVKTTSQTINVFPDATAMDWIKKAKVVHLASIIPDEYDPKFYSTLRNVFPGKIGLDGQGLARGKEKDFQKLISQRIDVLKVDEREASFLSGRMQEGAAIEEFLSWGVAEVLLTKGSQGAVLGTKEKIEMVSAVPAKKVVDATGCGDTFLAAYLYDRAKGNHPFQAAEFAANVASAKIEVQGPLLHFRSA